ncbi:MAG: DNA polymerase III subunit gamma/tau [Acholeplasmataceae bacterium]
MSYVALYRTYRPKKFSEVYGQKVIVKTLQNALKHEKFAHAYLFSGPRGTGKTSIAKIVAKTLNCREAPTDEPCGKCDICLGIEKGDISDVIEIDAASNNGVDEIRDLRDKVKYAPSIAKYKVYIIDEVHMLTQAAFNALLKTLEEPPKYVVFILATTEVHKVPATILSRCQRFDFKNIDNKDIEDNLIKITKNEKLEITEDAIIAIAKQSEGGMRDALSLLDQVLSFSDSKITEDDVYLVSGGLSRRFINELLLLIHNKEPQKTLNFLNEILRDGKDITRMVSDLILALRDLLLDKYLTKPNFPDLINLNQNVIYYYLDILNELQQDLKYTTSKRAYLELAIIKMINYKQLEDNYNNQINMINEKINSLESKINNNTVVKPQSKASKTTKRPLVTINEIENILNNGNQPIRKSLENIWPNLVKDAKPTNKGIAEILYEGELVAVGNNKMLIVYDNRLNALSLLKPSNKTRILEIIKKYENSINDYTVLLKPVWLNIKDDFMNQYNEGKTKPSLKPIDLQLYEEIKEQNLKNKEPEIVSFAKEYFGEIKVKVEE